MMLSTFSVAAVSACHLPARVEDGEADLEEASVTINANPDADSTAFKQVSSCQNSIEQLLHVFAHDSKLVSCFFIAFS
jgi:hypothetical protein